MSSDSSKPSAPADSAARARKYFEALSGGAAGMSTERPLDALLPGLTAPPPPVSQPVHTRVLSVDGDDGHAWVLLVTRDPGSARALHQQVLAILEAALLAELSQTPRRVAEGLQTYTALRMLVLVPLPYEVGPAVEAFGMVRTRFDREEAAAAATWEAVVAEAEQMRWDLPDSPQSVWETPIRHPDRDAVAILRGLQTELAQAMGDEVWGSTPGAVSRMASQLLDRDHGWKVTPDLQGVRELERLLVPTWPGVLRWIEPLWFQAMCDLIGVVAGAKLGVKVAWSVCEEAPSGLAPPAVFRVTRPDGTHYHLPIAHHLLRWSMMPLRRDEAVPSLADWMEDQFRNA